MVLQQTCRKAQSRVTYCSISRENEEMVNSVECCSPQTLS